MDDQVYTFPKNFLLRLAILSGVMLFFGFACNLALAPRIEKMVVAGISQNKACPIYHNDISVSLLTLSLKLKDVYVSGACWGNAKNTIALKEVVISLGFPGIWPPGIKANVSVKGEGAYVRLSFLLGLKRILYIRDDTRLSASILNNILGHGNILTGNLYMEGNLELKGNGIKAARLNLRSKHFGLLPKTIQAGALPFTLPALGIAPVRFEGELAKNTFSVDSFRLGNVKNGPLFVDLKGDVSFNKRKNRVKNVELEGKFKVSDELLSGSLSILNLVWNISKKPNKDGVYQVKFSGPFPNALTKPEFID